MHMPPNQSCLDRFRRALRELARSVPSCLPIVGRRSLDSRSRSRRNRCRLRIDHEARCDHGGDLDCDDLHGDLCWWGDHRDHGHGHGILECDLSL